MAKESVNQMIAEAFREIGVLIFVFSLLDKIVTGYRTLLWASVVVAISVAFFVAGVVLERTRYDESSSR
jgi:uncharacterized membrane protein YdbT with pleckstrin-like domain